MQWGLTGRKGHGINGYCAAKSWKITAYSKHGCHSSHLNPVQADQAVGKQKFGRDFMSFDAPNRQYWEHFQAPLSLLGIFLMHV